jgi:serine/threonine-protein phosphatase 2A regulatory subunit B''
VINIPQFYFPDGKPTTQEQNKEMEEKVDKAFGDKPSLKLEEFGPVTTDVCDFPLFFRDTVFNRIDTAKTGSVSKAMFSTFWKNEMERLPVARRFFKIISKPGKTEVTPDDFKPLFKYLLDSHPGLEFLQATPEFQDRYADTVVMRIFFAVDSNDDSKITFRDFKRSNLMDVFR